MVERRNTPLLGDADAENRTGTVQRGLLILYKLYVDSLSHLAGPQGVPALAVSVSQCIRYPSAAFSVYCWPAPGFPLSLAAILRLRLGVVVERSQPAEWSLAALLRPLRLRSEPAGAARRSAQNSRASDRATNPPPRARAAPAALAPSRGTPWRGHCPVARL